MAHELRDHARILCIDHVRLFEVPESAKGHITEIAYRRRYYRQFPLFLPFFPFIPFIPFHLCTLLPRNLVCNFINVARAHRADEGISSSFDKSFANVVE